MRRLVVLHLAVLVLGIPPARAAFPAPDPDAGPIEPVAVEWLSDRMVDISFANPRVDPPVSPAKVRLLVPADWEDAVQPYPVVLLLHGAGDRYDGWTEKHDGWPVTLEEFTADKDVVVVMPDGGTGDAPGWYSDWYNAGELGPPEWTTWHIAQLVPWVKANFPVRQDRGGWVVSGLSMGGFGTMSYLARHPDLFAAGYSFSGGLDNLALGNAFPDVWGDMAREEVRFRGHNPPDLVTNLHDAETVWFRTGRGVPGGPAPLDNHPGGIAIEAGAALTNDQFALALDLEGVSYTYDAYPLGAHNWWHWHDGFQNHAWPEMAELFTRTDIPDVPSAFRYRSIMPAFTVYGYEVAVDRDVVEFLDLESVSAGGLHITGSGTVRVRTPALYQPGATYRLEVEGSDTAAAATEEVVADAGGRLALEITLGPSHVFQQYTQQQRAAEAADPDYWQTATVAILGEHVRRVAGDRRHGTAVAVSATQFDQAEAVVLARAGDYPDALAGAPLARQLGGPLLLTDGDQLTDVTAEEIDRLGAQEAVILGGTQAIARTVEVELLARGVQPRRIAGPDRWETAAAIARELTPGFQDAFVVEGRHADPGRGWPDAVSAGPSAAYLGVPILLTARDELPDATADVLAEFGITATTVVGGPAAVSEQVLTSLDEAGHGPERVFGEDRYATSVALWRRGVGHGLSQRHLWLATGLTFPDALAAGPTVAAAGHSMLLVHGQDFSRSGPVPALLREHAGDITEVRLLGGTAAISAETAREVEAALR